MPSGFLTMLDIVKAGLGDDEVGLIDETMLAIPEVTGIHPLTGQSLPGVADARPIAGTTYKTSVRVELPSVTFRDLNEGTAYTKQRKENRTVNCYRANPKWAVDKDAGDENSTVAELLADEAAAHVMAYMQALGRGFFYGTNTDFGIGAKGFQGLLQQYDASNMTIDATGTTEDGCSSVWAVSFGTQSVRWVSGQNGRHEITDPREGDATDANGREFTAMKQEMYAHAGLQVGSQLQVARIKNLTAQSGKTLTGDMLGELIQKFKLSYRPQVIFAPKRCIEQYRQNLQSVTSSPVRVSTPYDFETIPLVPTESLTATEPVNLAA